METTTPEKVSEKQKIIMILLALFAGTLGIHRFYAGKIGTGIIMLLLSLSMIGIWISAIWAIIDLIIIVLDKFKDGNGLVISK